MSTKKVNVRWFDGLLESFDCFDVKLGGDLLYLELADTNRHIPLQRVRWYSVVPPSKEEK